MHKKIKWLLFYPAISALIILSLVQIFTPVNPVGVLFAVPTEVQNLPFGIKNFITTTTTFMPFKTLSLTSTPLTGVTCSLTNNGHIQGTDGSDTKVESATKLWNPTFFASLINPANGATLSQVKFIVYLYCQPFPSNLASAGYHPYLTGGTISMQFQALDSNGKLIVTQATQTVNISPAQVDVGTNSIPIATFTIPASVIQNAVGQKSVDYTSLQSAMTTGTLYFKQKLDPNQVNAVYVMQPLYTGYQFTVKGTGQGTITSTKQTIDMLTVGTSSGIDISVNKQISFKVGVDGWTSNQPYPVVDLVRKSLTGYGDTILKEITINSAPNYADSGTFKQWSYTIDANQLGLSVGIYDLDLKQVVLSNTQTRPATSVEFIISNVGSGSTGGNITCPDGTIISAGTCPNNPPPDGGNGGTTTCSDGSVISAGGVCPSGLPNNNGTQQQPQTCTGIGGLTGTTTSTNPFCIPTDPSQIIQLVQQNIVMITVIVIIFAVIFHFTQRSKGKVGLPAPQVIVE